MPRSKSAGSAPRARRGGRRPGEWTHVQPEDLVQFRQEHGVSRARLARALGVSATSVQNWEAGKVATLQTQERLREILDDPSRLSEGGGDDAETTHDEVVRATGVIVSGFASSHPELTADDLIVVIKKVREALKAP
jgi:transcriptional regulator with XRE-family HTH domain